MSEARGSYIWFLRNNQLFEDQTDSMYQSAELKADVLPFDRGDVLSVIEQEQRNIFVLMDGQVKLRSTTEGGKEIILDIMGPGDVFGPIDRALGHEHGTGTGPLTNMPTEAVALSKGEALRYDLSYIDDLLRRRPTLVVNVSRILGLRQRRFELRLGRLLYRSSLGKVAGLLAELGERYGSEKDGKIRIGVRLTHQEMASIVGLKRETVSESLAELELRGLIESSRSGILLVRPKDLDQLQ